MFCILQAGLVHRFFCLNLLFNRKNKALDCSQKSFSGIGKKKSAFLQVKDRILKHCVLLVSHPALAVQLLMTVFGLISFQRDEDTCPTLAPACSCTSGRPGLPGPPGPPVSSLSHPVCCMCWCCFVFCGMLGMWITPLGLC